MSCGIIAFQLNSRQGMMPAIPFSKIIWIQIIRTIFNDNCLFNHKRRYKIIYPWSQDNLHYFQFKFLKMVQLRMHCLRQWNGLRQQQFEPFEPWIERRAETFGAVLERPTVHDAARHQQPANRQGLLRACLRLQPDLDVQMWRAAQAGNDQIREPRITRSHRPPWLRGPVR